MINKLQWIYKIELTSKDQCSSTEIRLPAWSFADALNQIAETVYRNWDISRSERLTWITNLNDIAGEPKVVTLER